MPLTVNLLRIWVFMEFKTALFYVFSAIMIIAATRVITARNPVHAALFLVLAFFNAAGIWMLLKAEFLAIVLVLVYVGAVMVLFLFVVMMLDINIDRMREGFWSYLPMATAIGALIVLEMAAVLWRGFLELRAGSGRGRGQHRRHQGTGPADLHRVHLWL
jgi:NADH-quinone oxidoreductase subunit J